MRCNGFTCPGRPLRQRDGEKVHLRQGGHVENRCYAAISQDRCTHQSLHLVQVFFRDSSSPPVVGRAVRLQTSPIFLLPTSTMTTRWRSSLLPFALAVGRRGPVVFTVVSESSPCSAMNRHKRSTGIDSSRTTITSPCSAKRTMPAAAGASVSITDSSGSTSVRSSTRTSRPSSMASVRGSSMENC